MGVEVNRAALGELLGELAVRAEVVRIAHDIAHQLRRDVRRFLVDEQPVVLQQPLRHPSRDRRAKADGALRRVLDGHVRLGPVSRRVGDVVNDDTHALDRLGETTRRAFPRPGRVLRRVDRERAEHPPRHDDGCPVIRRW